MNRPIAGTKKLQTGLLFFVLFLPVSVVFLGSRALSQVTIGGIYFYDTVMILAFLSAGTFLIRQRRIGFQRGDVVPFAATMLLPLAATIWLFLSDFSRDALREFHPYLYLTYVPVVALALRNSSPRLLQIGLRMIGWALGLFWTLMSVRQLNSGLQWGLGGGIFEGFFTIRRPDVDGFILGIFAALVFLMAIRKRPQWRLPLFGLVILVHVQIAWMENRAAQVAALVMLVVAITSGIRKAKKSQSASLALRSAIQGSLVLILAVALSASITQIGDRYVGAALHFNVITIESQLATRERLVSGEGTVRARIDAWGTLYSWMSEEPARFALGVGVGSDYFWESGTREALMGTGKREENENRWPHNHFLTTLALLGFPMALLLLFLTVAGMYRLWRQVDPPLGDVREVALIVLSGVTVVSFFGVVFENPFGSLPFAWALGVAFAGHTWSEKSLSDAVSQRPFAPSQEQ